MAYLIPPENVAETREYLDLREVNGYSIQYATFRPADGKRAAFTCLVYIGLPSNPQFLGAQEPQAVAERIAQSEGPSGRNRDYLLMLEQSLNELAPESADTHVTDLAERLRRIEEGASAS